MTSTGRETEKAGAVDRGGLAARFVVHFTTRRIQIHAYEEYDDSYVFTSLTGGKGRYPKSLVLRIEPIEETPKSAPSDEKGVSKEDEP